MKGNDSLILIMKSHIKGIAKKRGRGEIKKNRIGTTTAPTLSKKSTRDAGMDAWLPFLTPSGGGVAKIPITGASLAATSPSAKASLRKGGLCCAV